jgi:hypothetical protein
VQFEQLEDLRDKRQQRKVRLVMTADRKRGKRRLENAADVSVHGGCKRGPSGGVPTGGEFLRFALHCDGTHV